MLNADDFGGYGTNANLVLSWGANWTLVGTDPWGGPQARVGASTPIKFTTGFVAGDTFIYAFRCKMNNWAAANSRWISICDINSVEHIRLRLAGDDTLEATRNGTAIVPGAGNVKGTKVFQDGATYWFSLKGKIHDTTGFLELKVDGITDISFTGADTKNAGTSDIPAGFLCDGNSDIHLSSWIVANTTAGDGIVDHIPPCRAERLIPNANGDLSGYVALGGGTLASELDDPATHDGDATRVSAAAPASFLVNMASIVGAPSAIIAAYAEIVHEKDDAGACTARIDVKAAGVTQNGPTLAPTGGNYTTDKLMLGDTPASIPWSVADINGVQVGATRIT